MKFENCVWPWIQIGVVFQFLWVIWTHGVKIAFLCYSNFWISNKIWITEFYDQRIFCSSTPKKKSKTKKSWPNATQRQRWVLYNVSNYFNNANVHLSKSPLIPGRYLDGDKISKSHRDKYTKFQRVWCREWNCKVLLQAPRISFNLQLK